MSTSIVSRGQGIMTAQGGSSAPLQAGITQKAFRRLVYQYPNRTEPFAAYIEKSVDSVVPYFQNATFDISYPLDRLSNGNNLITLSQETGNTTFSSTVEALRQSIDLQPRNLAGGLWYYVYPNWSYLDGMYSFAPFAALYAATYNKTNIDTVLNNIVLQFDLLWDHCYDNSTNLLVHGYDYSKTAIWANPDTGRSPYVWGRSLGWYLMALVDTLEILLPYRRYSQWMILKSQFEKLSTALVKAVDPASGAWWQILNAPGRSGNYIESSGSSIFVYALLKGERLGWLSGVQIVAVRAYNYIADTFVDEFHNGTLGWNGTVAVCSLNSTASFEYYISQPILYNSVLGSGAFVLASLEYELLL
ncbi:glycoside hydrolase family 105 protein [Zopfia rhizophila CBS 207.26]|uniref:Glycoside hydrolase family 105 protein n=1 Tax=Zopfia rhizophila CBS 207.26 TaxID=1314779 RepID=A0A6A6DB38_9PEZI|nr:glycoside hydrolase family 105 protein [Zopfia rhizophila CBS 207.26]